MNNRLLALYLGDRAAVLGKVGLLALAITLAPLALTANGVVREQAYAASDVPGLDDPATHNAADDNGVDNADGNDVSDDNGNGVNNPDGNDVGDDNGVDNADGNDV